MLRLSLIPAAVLAALPMNLAAHPHEFVDTGLTFHFDEEGRLGAVGVTWLYDDLTSLLILEDLGMDRDGDGHLTPAEEAQLSEMAGNWPDDFDGNLTLVADNRPVALSGPLDARSGLRGGRVYMTYLRALPARADPAKTPLVLQVYDPTYYTFYDLLATPLIEGRAGCNVLVEPADIGLAQRLYDEALAGMTDEELMDEGKYPEVGGAFADIVRLTCTPEP